MNHFAAQVCVTRLKVTVLRHDVNHVSQQIDSENLPFCYLGMSPEIQHLSEKKANNVHCFYI